MDRAPDSLQGWIMADILNPPGQGKGLFALTTKDGSISQQGHVLSDGGFSADTIDDPHHEALAGDQENSGAFANLMQDQMVAEENSTKASGRTKDTKQQPSDAVFYAAEPLIESPSGKYQLTMLDGEALPGSGKELPFSGNLVPKAPELLPSSTANSQEGGGPGGSAPSDSLESLIQVVEGDGEIGTDNVDLLNQYPEGSAITDDVDLLTDEEKDSVFDDLAFIKEHAADTSGSVEESIQTAAESKLTADISTNGLPVESTEEIAEADLESATIKSQLVGNSQAGFGEDGISRKSKQVIGESSVSERAQSRVGVSTDGQNQENSRQQFANQLAQSSIGETDLASKSVREGVPQAQASPQGASQVQSSIEQVNATRIENTAATSEKLHQSSGEGKAADLRLAVPFSRKDWNEQLGKQLSFLVSRNMDSAQIQLDPPELGPLQVRINIQQDQVALQFQAQHGMVREALDQSIGRLQELFSEEGLDLVSVDVSDGSADNDSSAEGEEGERNPVSESGEESDEILTPVHVATNSDGKIDYFI